MWKPEFPDTLFSCARYRPTIWGKYYQIIKVRGRNVGGIPALDGTLFSLQYFSECANRGFLYLCNKCLAVHRDILETQRESRGELNDPYLPGKHGCVGRPWIIK